MKEFLIAYKNPNVRIFRRQIFDKTVQDIHTGRVFQVKAGIKGQADAYAYIKNSGLAYCLEIEFKAARTPISKEQISWYNFCDKWRVPYIELRAKLNEENTIARWCKELDQKINYITISENSFMKEEDVRSTH